MTEQQPKRVRKYTWFIGVDISKQKLDFAVMHNKNLVFHKEVPNEIIAIRNFILELKSLSKFSMIKSIFGMEKMGFYTNHLTQVLLALNANFVAQSPLQIKRSFGLVRGKNDKIDAIRIAEYVFIHRESLTFWQPKRQVIEELAVLSNMRSRLLKSAKCLSVPLKAASSFVGSKVSSEHKKYCSRTLDMLKADVSDVDLKLQSLIDNDPELKRLFELIVSVDFVGPQTAINVIIYTNEFKETSNPKQFASYSGIAPFPKESGTIKNKGGVSSIANKKLKSLLHICAVGSLKSKKGFRAYYDRKTEVEGKAPLSVINAIKNKIVLRIFACVNQNRKFESEYLNTKSTHLISESSED